MFGKSVIVFLAFIMLTSTLAYADTKSNIIDDLSRAVEGNFDKYDILAGKLVNSSDLFIIYNRSDVSNSEGLIQCADDEHIENDKCVPNSGPVPVPCPDGTKLVDGKCVPDLPPDNECPPSMIFNQTSGKCEEIPMPPEPPGPNASSTTIVVSGDVKGSTGIKVSDAAQKENADNYVSVGDNGYTSSTSYYNTNFEQKLGPGKNDCVIGNHDTEEDGSEQLGKDFTKLCGDHWSRVTANGTTLMVGLNTNGDRQTQIDFYKDVVDNDDYSNVLVFTHKNGHVPPNSHHPAEALQLYQAVEAATPSTVNLLEIGGHNHIMGGAFEQGWFIIGAGGASHYSCGTNETWKFCNNDDYGYLKIIIDNNNAALTAAFYDINGKVLN